MVIIEKKSFCDLVFSLTSYFLVFGCSHPDPLTVPKRSCFSMSLNMDSYNPLFFLPFPYQIYTCHFKPLLKSGNLFRFINSESFVCLYVICGFIFIVIIIIKDSCQLYNIFYAGHTHTRIGTLYVFL